MGPHELTGVVLCSPTQTLSFFRPPGMSQHPIGHRADASCALNSLSGPRAAAPSSHYGPATAVCGPMTLASPSERVPPAAAATVVPPPPPSPPRSPCLFSSLCFVSLGTHHHSAEITINTCNFMCYIKMELVPRQVSNLHPLLTFVITPAPRS